MLEYTPLNGSRESVGETQTLQKGESGRMKFRPHRSKRSITMTFDFTGVVSATAREDRFDVLAHPVIVARFESGGKNLSNLLSIGQEVVYMLKGRFASKLSDDVPAGVRVKRLAAVQQNE